MHGFFHLFRCNVHLAIAAEKHQQTREFCDDIINLRKQIACKKKSSNQTCLRRNGEEGEAEFVQIPRISTRATACELGMPQKTIRKILRKEITSQTISFAIDTTVNRGREVCFWAALRTIDRMMLQNVWNKLDYR
ncbi:hypothetical protein TNCV_191931 [Trichonephila clavipes]|nr:hypothetical protein TNCV_191931 [Trichonephila clavipes]